jgi:hypothetical protein
METEFMARLDRGAAEALEKLEIRVPLSKWSDELRSHWARFLLAQGLRSPDSISELKTIYESEWRANVGDFEQIYLESRAQGDDTSYGEFLRQNNLEYRDEYALRHIQELMDLQKVGEAILALQWHVFETPDSSNSLLTSDRPVLMRLPLGGDGALIVIPIGPNRVFVAAARKEAQKLRGSVMRSQFVKSLNRQVVRQAHKYVVSINGQLFTFIGKHMAAEPAPSLGEQLMKTRAMRRR